MAITPLPTPPSRNDPANFAARADAFLGALPAFATETNATALAADADAAAALASQILAANYAQKNDNYATSTDNSAKSWAIGGTGNGKPAAGSAKDWASLLVDPVAGGEYSAKFQAQASAASAVLSNNWATLLGAPVAGGEYSAKFHAQAAAASAASAINSPGTNATSTTSQTIVNTGSLTFTIQTGKAYAVGQFVILASSASPLNYMVGQITAHNSDTGSMTVNVTTSSGSGNYNAWIISLTAAGGGGGGSVSVGKVYFFSGF
jgi:hypothetical protein